jgi:hypothetical protein
MKRVMRISTWNVRSLYMSDSFTTVSCELAKYRLDLVSVQKVRRGKGGTVRAGGSTFSAKKEIINWEEEFL